MATLKLYLDTRSKSKRGENSLKIRITQNRKTAYISLDIFIAPHQWDEATGRIVNHEQEQSLNELIKARMNEATNIITALKITKEIDNYSATDLRDRIEGNPSKKEKKTLFIEKFKSFAKARRGESTRADYMHTLKRMGDFDRNLGIRTFEDIDKDYMASFDRYLAETCSVNSRAHHYRNIRAVFNDAIDDEITMSYPFRKFKIRTQETAKRSLTFEQLRQLRDYPCDDHLIVYQEMFMLMFYLCGINAADLFQLKPDAIHKGRLEYNRKKTGKFYSIRIEPEAQVLLDKYKGEEYLLNVCDGRASYKSFLKSMGMNLKKIGSYKRKGRGGKKIFSPLFPNLSQYWCRHSWATLAADLDIPDDTIALSLGHAMGNKTTAIYINRNRKKVDDANRKIIDFLKKDVPSGTVVCSED